MEQLAPAGDVYQAGTLSGNPLATAAGLSVLRRLRDPAVYEELERPRRAARGGAARGRGGHACQRVGAMADALHDRAAPVTDFEDASACDTERYGALFRHLLERGIYVAPSQFEAMFLSLAHGDDEIDRTVEAVAELLRSTDALGRRSPPRPARESPLWAAALRPEDERELEPVFSPLARAALRARARDDLRGLPRPLRPAAPVRARRRRTRRSCSATTSTRTGSSASPRSSEVEAVADLAELISLCCAARAPTGATATARRGPRRLRCSARASSTRRARRSGSTATRPARRARARRPPATRRSSARSLRTACGCVRVRADGSGARIPAPTRPSEGSDVIRAMLIVGLVFVGVIALGELAHWWATARRDAQLAHRPPQRVVDRRGLVAELALPPSPRRSTRAGARGAPRCGSPARARRPRGLPRTGRGCAAAACPPARAIRANASFSGRFSPPSR